MKSTPARGGKEDTYTPSLRSMLRQLCTSAEHFVTDDPDVDLVVKVERTHLCEWQAGEAYGERGKESHKNP